MNGTCGLKEQRVGSCTWTGCAGGTMCLARDGCCFVWVAKRVPVVATGLTPMVGSLLCVCSAHAHL